MEVAVKLCATTQAPAPVVNDGKKESVSENAASGAGAPPESSGTSTMVHIIAVVAGGFVLLCGLCWAYRYFCGEPSHDRFGIFDDTPRESTDAEMRERDHRGG